MGDIRIGTCGYSDYRPPAGWQDRYASKLAAFADVYALVEINSTFYQLPKVATCERWRAEAGERFEFTVKAWQGLTHPLSSPTWRKRSDKLTNRQREELGHLRPTPSVFDAWDATRACCEAVGARVCVVQTPATFTCTQAHREQMTALLGRIDRGGLALAWEPRGDWHDHPEILRAVCDELDLIHTVDLLRRGPLSSHPLAYIRLHGLNRREHDYHYDYSDGELGRLADALQGLALTRERVYCLFNNTAMHANAKTLEAMLAGHP